MKKKAASVVLAIVMLVGTVPAYAADVTTAGGKAESQVTLNVGGTTPQIFSATIPSEIPISINKDGVVTVASNLKISNASSAAIEVTAIEVAGKGGWGIKDYTYDMASEASGTKYLALQFRGDSTDQSGAIGLSAGNWEIAKYSDLMLNAEAKLPSQTESSDNDIATVTWTLDWANSNVTPPTPPEPTDPVEPSTPPDQGITYTIQVASGEHGNVDDSSAIITDADGKIVGFPSVTPDSFYKLSHWIDGDGAVVDGDTVFDSDSTITPVFVLDTEAWYTVSGSTITGMTDDGFAALEAGHTDLVIPSTINGVTITEIGDNAFYAATGSEERYWKITSVSIPGTVATVGSFGFAFCRGITNLTLEEGTTTLKDSAFYGCFSITSVESLAGVQSIGPGAFRSCSHIVDLVVPDTVQEIGENAFGAVPHIQYSGSLEGAPWGAKAMN